MRATIRARIKEAELPTGRRPTFGDESKNNDTTTDSRNWNDHRTNHDERDMERAIREVAEYQAHLRDHQVRQYNPNESVNQDFRGELPEETGENQVMATLQIAQHEWRKVLDGSKGSGACRPVLPVTDAISNTYWGDACGLKNGYHIRLYVQNVNGITLDRRGGQFDSICQVQKEIQADVFLGQEHNLDSTQFQVKSILHATSKQHWERYRLNIGTTPISFQSMYKPGGTFMLTVGNTTGRILTQNKDKWGRWVSQTFQGREGRTLTIVSAYQVVTDFAKAGTTTVATQQYSLLVQEQDQTLAPRAAFRRDLRIFLQQCRDRGEELILVGDFNEAIGEDSEGMLSVIQGLGLVDLMGSRHNQSLPITYARGRRCIDYGFATANVCAALEKCGYEGFHHRLPSDHRGYFFDFDIRRLLGTQIQPLSKFEPRLLYSTNIKNVSRYLQKMNAIMISCNAYTRGDRLGNPGRRDAFAERLDSDVLNGSLAGERTLPTFQEPEWSQILVRARLKVSILQKILSCVNHARECPQSILDQFQEYCPDWTIPTTRATCQTYLRISRESVQAIVKDSFGQRDSEFRNRIESLEASGTDRKSVV